MCQLSSRGTLKFEKRFKETTSNFDPVERSGVLYESNTVGKGRVEQQLRSISSEDAKLALRKRVILEKKKTISHTRVDPKQVTDPLGI